MNGANELLVISETVKNISKRGTAKKGYNSATSKGSGWSYKASPITFGNKKMSIPCFSITQGETCTGSTPLCRKYCYARSAWVMFPNVRKKRAGNLALTKSPEFVSVMIEEISQVPFIPYFRVHEAGDFYSQEYLEKWFEIARAFPEKKFLAFTKCFGLDFSKKPKNFNIYFSIWPDSDITGIKASKKIHRAYTVVDLKHFIKAGLYQDMKVSKTAQKCKGHCDKCLICFNGESDVFFPIH